MIPNTITMTRPDEFHSFSYTLFRKFTFLTVDNHYAMTLETFMFDDDDDDEIRIVCE